VPTIPLKRYLVAGFIGALTAVFAVFAPPYFFVLVGAPYYGTQIGYRYSHDFHHGSGLCSAFFQENPGAADYYRGSRRRGGDPGRMVMKGRLGYHFRHLQSHIRVVLYQAFSRGHARVAQTAECAEIR
jgi:hypothetical protein